MNPDQFPNPNTPDDGMPMFGGSGARWPGHEDYGFSTPGSVESAIDADSDFDPFFGTEGYDISDMEPSCGQPPAPEPRPKTMSARKKRMARKDKASAVPLPTPNDNINETYAEKRMEYSDAEYKVLVECWIDISEDPIYSNNQTMSGYWARIEQKYNSRKPRWAYKRHKEQLRKCWDRIKGHVNNFSNIYTRRRDARASGESMEDVLNGSMAEYQGLYGQFKFYNIWLMLKDKPKFDGGITPSMSTSKRTKVNSSGEYTSSGGPIPVDLNEEPQYSSGTPTSTARRPIGIKTAKAQAKGKGKATSSAPQEPQEPQAPVVGAAVAELEGLKRSYDMRLLLDTANARDNAPDPASRKMYSDMLEILKTSLGLN